MPRGLYARAALILLLPVLTIQLLVSVVFIQRHFEGVTNQMTSSVAIELRYLIDIANETSSRVDAQQRVNEVATPLEFIVNWPEASPTNVDDKPLTDFTGNSVMRFLLDAIPEIQEISLADRRRVKLWLETQHGPMVVDFPRKRVSASNPHQLLVIMVILGGVMTLIAYFFLRNQLRPIKRLATAAQAFGKGQVREYAPAGAAEVRAAGAAFLDMRNRIERHTQNRTMMLSGVSHDLRTPLTRLKLGLSMIDGVDTTPLIADVDEMEHLLDGFLDFARTNADDDVVEVTPRVLVDQILEKAHRGNMAISKGESSGDDQPVSVRLNALNRALDNLCNNALRYGTEAVLSSIVTERSVKFVVEDDGPGIKAEDREKAIRPFVRLDPARNQNRGTGVGLGLSIVNDIARVQGGMLRLGRSEKLGGLKAEIVLPR